MYAGFTLDQITAVGGKACAFELAAIFSAAERHVAEVAGDPADLQQLVDAGYLDALPALWQLTDDELVPAPESGCLSLSL